MDEIVSQIPSVNAWSAGYVESLYEKWLQDRSSINGQWKYFFEGFELGLARESNGTAPVATGPGTPAPVASAEYMLKQAHVWSLVYHYRDIGHLMAKVDPLERERPRPDNLRLEAFELNEIDLDREFITPIHGFEKRNKLRDIITYLESIYCSTLGAEYLHIQNTPERRWIQDRLENPAIQFQLSVKDKYNILRKLHQAEIFENFLHTRYRGQKRFSLEGSETLIPILWYALETAGCMGITDVVFGMAHRGRLNVLANIINKAYDDIFAEFEDNYIDRGDGGGDVKYHKGYSSNFMTSSGNLIYLTLAANPSHLEAVYPVVEGRCRAKQRIKNDTERSMVMPLLIHGDAAFAGQGIVAETLQMVKLPGYTTGGTIHIIVNNQIGFTTDPRNSRSSQYCTDVAKMVQAPILHVNADDPEVCARAIRLAVEYRQKFHKDFIIDMWCFRKYGHNEGDEPAFTQPRMYEIIRQKKSSCTIYMNRLKADGVIDDAEIQIMHKDLEEILEAAQLHGKETPVKKNQAAFRKKWDGFRGSYSFDQVDTTASPDALRLIAEKCTVVPQGFEPHRKVAKIYEQRRDAVLNEEPMDWGTGEMLAIGALLHEGTPVRLTGQDSRRGTFSHRHAVLTDVNTEETYVPLNHLSQSQARFCIYDSPLSEVSALGFEYGYSLGDPDMLVIWEAQFGDFANGAQTIIDQFIASAESKWDRYSGLVLLLPHGYEGQGPEHSSARPERFLQLCADDNIQVANPTTPAQFFHLLRRQMKRRFRKPLVVMSPKSLLRHPRATSRLKELTEGSFREVIDDHFLKDRRNVRRVLLCSGKVYYDLIAHREEIGNDDTAIIRVEQLYPLNTIMIQQLLARYPEDAKLFWCQEEPKNMGAWMFISDALAESVDIEIRYIGRLSSASPAVGSPRAHNAEQRALLEAAFTSDQEITVATV